jgi:hypothetical protein
LKKCSDWQLANNIHQVNILTTYSIQGVKIRVMIIFNTKAIWAENIYTLEVRKIIIMLLAGNTLPMRLQMR